MSCPNHVVAGCFVVICIFDQCVLCRLILCLCSCFDWLVLFLLPHLWFWVCDVLVIFGNILFLRLAFRRLLSGTRSGGCGFLFLLKLGYLMWSESAPSPLRNPTRE